MEELNPDILSTVASFLTAKDLLSVAATSTHFGGTFADEKKEGKRRKKCSGPSSRSRMRSLMEDAAQTNVMKAIKEHKDWDRGDNLKRGGHSWYAAYHRLVQLHTQPVFYRVFGTRMTYHDSTDLSQVRYRAPRDMLMTASWEMPLVICQEVMTTSIHYIEFKVVRGGDAVKVGIIRPAKEWDDKRASIGLLGPDSAFIHFCVEQRSLGNEAYAGDVHHCLFMPAHRHEQYEDHIAPGTPSVRDNDVIGLYLNLDIGLLSLYLNDRELGVTKRGLSGHYCWAVSVGESRPIIKISRPPFAELRP